jgi:hypothetical protein
MDAEGVLKGTVKVEGEQLVHEFEEIAVDGKSSAYVAKVTPPASRAGRMRSSREATSCRWSKCATISSRAGWLRFLQLAWRLPRNSETNRPRALKNLLELAAL